MQKLEMLSKAHRHTKMQIAIRNLRLVRTAFPVLDMLAIFAGLATAAPDLTNPRMSYFDQTGGEQKPDAQLIVVQS